MPIKRPTVARRRDACAERSVCIALMLALCLVMAAPFSTVAALSSGNALAAPLKIMPLGDSITDGYNVPGGYRAELWRLLDVAGTHVNFVVSLQSGPSGLPDKDHEGHSGWCISPLLSSVPG